MFNFIFTQKEITGGMSSSVIQKYIERHASEKQFLNDI